MVARRSRRLVVIMAMAGLALSPQQALAHLTNTGLGPYYDGISHFMGTPEDFLSALALALLAGLRGVRAGRLTFFLLPASWFVGGLLGLALPSWTDLPALTTITFIALGGFVAADARLEPEWVAALALGLGLVHGYLNGSSYAVARVGVVALLGSVSALFVVVSLTAALVVSLRVAWTRIAVRVAGSWIAAIGLLLLGWSLRAGRG